jgi:hypothetical protein
MSRQPKQPKGILKRTFNGKWFWQLKNSNTVAILESETFEKPETAEQHFAETAEQVSTADKNCIVTGDDTNGYRYNIIDEHTRQRKAFQPWAYITKHKARQSMKQAIADLKEANRNGDFEI